MACPQRVRCATIETMQHFHVVGGLLRSGSTLLCNILNQNPRMYVSSTSPLFAGVSALSSVWSQSAETRGMLVRDRDGMLERMTRTTRAVCDAWYAHVDNPVVIDKSRGWNFDAALLGNVWPDAKLITISRDLRSIYASIERRHLETAILDPNMGGKTLIGRAKFMFSPDGPLGAALIGMEDLCRRRPDNWHWLRYEDLCRDPATALSVLYEALGEDHYEHDFTNVVNVAEDVDEMYLLKFPHEGCGPVRAPVDQDWLKWVSPDIEALIMESFELYNVHFGYAEPKKNDPPFDLKHLAGVLTEALAGRKTG